VLLVVKIMLPVLKYWNRSKPSKTF